MKPTAGSVIIVCLKLCEDDSKPCSLQLLALQILCRAATQAVEHKLVRMRTAILAVVRVMLDHQTAFVRQAASQTRNVWFMIEE
mmetsp:Transcript_31098/g.71678  ORF Transcript_31098/g.71678 Transcript_31098/m.71678 type:complete len:84 (-) Transcript_31098:1389-1640(-)